MKKMKKRRELDALVGNGKQRRKNSKSDRELLKNDEDDSESSEAEEFVVPVKKMRKRRSDRGGNLCVTCFAIVGVFFLAVSLVSCVGLLWLHFDTRSQLESLQHRLDIVETGNLGSVSVIDNINSKITKINQTTEKHNETVSKQLKSLTTKLDDLLTKVEKLKNQVEHAKSSATDSALKDMVETLAKAVATDASKNSEAIETLEASIQTQIDSIQTVATNSTKNSDAIDVLKTEIETVQVDIEKLRVQSIPDPGKPRGHHKTGSEQIVGKKELLKLVEDGMKVFLENKNNTMIADIVADRYGGLLNETVKNLCNCNPDVKTDEDSEVTTDVSTDLNPDLNTYLNNAHLNFGGNDFSFSLPEVILQNVEQILLLNSSFTKMKLDMTSFSVMVMQQKNNEVVLSSRVEEITRYLGNQLNYSNDGMDKNDTKQPTNNENESTSEQHPPTTLAPTLATTNPDGGDAHTTPMTSTHAVSKRRDSNVIDEINDLFDHL